MGRRWNITVWVNYPSFTLCVFFIDSPAVAIQSIAEQSAIQQMCRTKVLIHILSCQSLILSKAYPYWLSKRKDSTPPVFLPIVSRSPHDHLCYSADVFPLYRARNVWWRKRPRNVSFKWCIVMPYRPNHSRSGRANFVDPHWINVKTETRNHHMYLSIITCTALLIVVDADPANFLNFWLIELKSILVYIGYVTHNMKPVDVSGKAVLPGCPHRINLRVRKYNLWCIQIHTKYAFMWSCYGPTCTFYSIIVIITWLPSVQVCSDTMVMFQNGGHRCHRSEIKEENFSRFAALCGYFFVTFVYFQKRWYLCSGVVTIFSLRSSNKYCWTKLTHSLRKYCQHWCLRNHVK